MCLPVRDDAETRAEVNFDVALNSGGGGSVAQKKASMRADIWHHVADGRAVTDLQLLIGTVR